MSVEPMHSDLPYSSVDTRSGISFMPRLDLDGIALPEAVTRVLAYCQTQDASREQGQDRSGPFEKAVPQTAAAATVLNSEVAHSWLMFVDLARGRCRLGGSAFVRALLPEDTAQVELRPASHDAVQIEAANAVVAEAMAAGHILARNHRSAGGLLACVVAMAAPADLDVALNIDPLLIEGLGDGRMDSGEAKNWTQQISGLRHELTLRALFNEEPGLVLQVADSHRDSVLQTLRKHGLGPYSHFIARLHAAGANSAKGERRFSVWRDTQSIFAAPLTALAMPGVDVTRSSAH